METKSHWVFDYIIDQDKNKKKDEEENNIQKSKFVESQSPNNDKIRTNSRSKEKFTFIAKDPKISDSINSPSTSFFNKQKNNLAKPINIKNNSLKYNNDEDSSLSYRKKFNFQLCNSKSFKSCKELINPINNYDNSYTNSFSLSNLARNNMHNEKFSKDEKPFLKVPNYQEKLINETNNIKQIETTIKTPVGKKLNTNRLKNTQNNNIKKRVSFSDINQIIPDDVFSNIKFPIIKPLENNQKFDIYNNSLNPTHKKIISNEENSKFINKIDNSKQGYFTDLYDKERISKEINKEFDCIFRDLNDLEKYSNHTISTSPPSIIDDLRVVFLDFTTHLEMKKSEIENNIRKNNKI